MIFRKAEKDEERRAREKIRQKLEEDKVFDHFTIIYWLLGVVLVWWLGMYVFPANKSQLISLAE